MIKCPYCFFEYDESKYSHYCGISPNSNITIAYGSKEYYDSTYKALSVNDRIRGFEKISKEQWEKDTLDIISPHVSEWLTLECISLPKRATSRSAGYDIFSPFGFILKPNESIKIPTGFKAYMMDDEKLVFHPRSGLGFKYFVRLANTTGVGDSDYYNNEGNEGHYWVKIRNEGDKEVSVEAGDAIAQCIFEKYLLADGDSFIDGKSRIGGLGSTG